jgi:CheY-like chemotaxis protein
MLVRAVTYRARPRFASTGAAARRAQVPLPPVVPARGPYNIMNRKKVLVVDDNAIILKTLSTKLTAAGYDVITAEDGGSASSAARQEKPDLILLDIGFPPDVGHGGGVAWDGFLIMTWLQRMEETRHIPIIVITAAESDKYRDRALAAGAASFFHKPINHDDLLGVMAIILDRRNGQSQAPAAAVAQPAK